jgi:hypothetical protein
MIGELLVRNVWVVLGIWSLLYISDYALTIIGAKLHRRGACAHFAFEKGYELNPLFQKDIELLRYLSPRFILMLFITCFLIWLVHALLWKSIPNLYAFLVGAYLFVELCIHFRHVKNIFLFRYAKEGKGVRGKIEYSRWLSFRLSAVEFICFSGLFVISFIITGSYFLLGGAVTCFLNGLKHAILAGKERRSVDEGEEGSSGNEKGEG